MRTTNPDSDNAYGVAAAQQTNAPRDADQILSTNVTHYRVRAMNLLQATAQIASDFDLPMGVARPPLRFL